MAPWKCPDCGTWWSGLEHRCPPIPAPVTNWPPTTVGTSTVTCTCTYDDHGNRRINTAPCPVHDSYQVFYTGWGGA